MLLVLQLLSGMKLMLNVLHVVKVVAVVKMLLNVICVLIHPFTAKVVTDIIRMPPLLISVKLVLFQTVNNVMLMVLNALNVIKVTI